MTFQQAITDARSELGDTYDGSYTYHNDDMLRYAIDGVREAWRTRPSLKYDESTGCLYNVAVVFPDTIGDTLEIPLPDSTHQAITYYVVYGCLSRDVTDDNNASMAEIAKQRFTTVVLR